MPLIDNTFVVFASQGTALAWPSGARISQVRLLALNTLASCVFQAVVGTPIFEWRYLVHGTVTPGSGVAVVDATHTIPMGNVSFPTAWIPTTMTACTAWIDFS